MPSWGNNDNAANTPLWAATMVHRAPTAANAALLFANTTANAFIQNETVGVFGVDANQADVAAVHTGWVLRTVGQGGRAGRVLQEVLVATSNMYGAGGNYPSYVETIITINSQPANNAAVHGTGNTVTFSVAASANPSATLSYYWQYYNGSVWANTSTAGTLFVGNTSPVLVANATATTANTYLVRAVISSANAATVTSANAKVTIF
jgi:hypothetical protein